MTLSEIIREVGELGARSPRIQQDIKGWVNRAQRAIAQRRNWPWMHSQQTATILAGATSIALSARFKELAPEKTPITYTAPLASFPTPVHVKSRAELEAINPGVNGYVTNSSGFWSPFYVFLEQNDGGLWTLNTPLGFTHATPSTYTISCYLYPADLSLGSDSNGLTTDGELTEALIAKTKAMAWQAEDMADPRAAVALQQYEQHIRTAGGQASRKALAGRSIHW